MDLGIPPAEEIRLAMQESECASCIVAECRVGTVLKHQTGPDDIEMKMNPQNAGHGDPIDPNGLMTPLSMMTMTLLAGTR